ncbi:unnamed protein product, partial [Phaeothamnion confervicola]
SRHGGPAGAAAAATGRAALPSPARGTSAHRGGNGNNGQAGSGGDDDDDGEESWVGFEGEQGSKFDGGSTSEFEGLENASYEEYDNFFDALGPRSPPGGNGGGNGNGNGHSSTLPQTVDRYIGARARLERRLSASGPLADGPDAGRLAPAAAAAALADAGSVTGMIRSLWAGNGAGTVVARGLASAAQRTEQPLPFTEALFKAGVSETAHSTKQGILLEGYLTKFSPGGLKGVRWHRRYFVLYAGGGIGSGANTGGGAEKAELRYYKSSAAAAWGVIPLGERGAVPLRLVTRIEQPSHAKWKGCRFDLVVRYRGEGRYPGCHIRPGKEHEVRTTKTFKLCAEDAQQRLLWVTVIESLMKRHGW